MRSQALLVLVVACCSVACAQNSLLESARTACAGFSTPLPEGATVPVLIKHVKPEPGPHAPYPSANACLQVQVEADGSVTFMRTVSATNTAFAELFRQAVVRWRYQPATLDGKPIPVSIAVSAAFEHH